MTINFSALDNYVSAFFSTENRHRSRDRRCPLIRETLFSAATTKTGYSRRSSFSFLHPILRDKRFLGKLIDISFRLVNNFQEGRNYCRLFLEKSSIISMHIIFTEFETVKTVDSCEVDT